MTRFGVLAWRCLALALAARKLTTRLSTVVVTSSLLMASPVSAQPALEHPWMTASELPDPLRDVQAFEAPPAETRPGLYWWWQDRIIGQGSPFDAAQAADELHAMADAGFGKPHIEHWGRDYANEQQRQNLESVAPIYRERGLQLEQTLGLGFPWTSPATTHELAMSQQVLMYGRTDVVGPTVFSGPPPAPIGGGGGDLIAVTAARVLEEGPPVTERGTPPPRPTILDPDSLVDVSSKVVDGTIEWDVPDGDWIIFAFWAQNPNTGGFLAGPGGKVSITSADSTRAGLAYVADNQIGDAADSLAEVVSAFYEESQEDGVDGLYWNNTENDKTLEEFEHLRGYDVTRYLPLLFVQGKYELYVEEAEPTPDFDLRGGQGARYRHDYDETVTDLYIQKHLLVMQEWAEERYGGRIDSQAAYGTVLDVVRANRALTRAGGLADTEAWSGGDWDPYQTQLSPNWRYALDFYRQASSGAAQGGDLEISLEVGDTTSYELLQTLGDLKYTVDKAWAAGITRPEIHGVTLQPADAPWPGVSRWNGLAGITESWNHRTFPEWGNFRPLSDYWGRGALILEQGVARTDVAFLRDHRTLIVPPLGGIGKNPQAPINHTRKLEEAGFTVGYVDPVGVHEQPPGPDGELFPDGPAYRAVVIDGANQNYVDPRAIAGETARALDKASAKGLAVVFVGEPPVRGNSGRNPDHEDAQVRAAIDRITQRPTTHVVASVEDVADALEEIGVRPAAEWPGDLAPQMENLVSGGVYSQLRERGSTKYFYLWNSSEQPVRYTGSFKARGNVRELDLWSGEIEPVGIYQRVRGRTNVPVELGPGETKVLAFRPGKPLNHAQATTADRVVITDEGGVELQDDRGGPQSVTVSTKEHRVKLPVVADDPITVGAAGSGAPWNLTVTSWGPDGRLNKPVLSLADGLASWSEIPELVDTSGVGTYTATVTLPQRWTALDRGVRLNLGEIAGGSVRTYVNDALVLADVSPNGGVQTDITHLLQPGENEIRVVLFSTLFNRARAEPAASLGRTSFDVTKTAHPNPQMSGLLGPVVLTPYARSADPLRD